MSVADREADHRLPFEWGSNRVMANGIDRHATARARYNRIAPVYDFLETFLEHSFKP